MEQKTEASQAVKFRKKPVEIEAVQWTGSNLVSIIEFTDGRKPDNRHDFAAMKRDEYAELVKRDGLKIFTLEGKMNADVGDWIIKGVKGEFYPCKPDIFELTYERASLKAQPASTEAPSKQKPFAWAYRAVNSDNWHATTDKEWAHAIQNMERKPLYEHPDPTEAAQYPNTPEIDALMEKWGDDGATRGAAFIELRDKARQIERAFYAAVEQVRTMAEAAQGEGSARLDAMPMWEYYGCTEAEWIEFKAWSKNRARASAETGGVKS